MKIKYVIAHIHTIDVKNATASVSVLYIDGRTLYWNTYDKSNKNLVLFDTRSEADQAIKEVFNNEPRYISYGINVGTRGGK